MKLSAVLRCAMALALVVAACSGDDAEETSTTTSSTTTVAPVTTIAPVGSTTTSAAPVTTASTTTDDPAGEPSFPEYTIVARETGDGGDTVVVLLDADTFGSLTDIDLQNIVADLVERFPPIVTAHVIDDETAIDAVAAEEPTAAQQEILDRHYLVRLEEGFRLIFAGPFSETPMTILGS